MNRAVFLDRDGVLNAYVRGPEAGKYDSPLKPEQAVLLPGVTESLESLERAGYLCIGHGKGKMRAGQSSGGSYGAAGKTLDRHEGVLDGRRQDVDVLCGRSIGLKTILVQYPHTAEYRSGEKMDYLAADIREAARIICGAL